MKMNSKRKLLYKIIYIVSILLIILSISYIVNFFSLKKEAIEESNLLNTMEANEQDKINNEATLDENNVKQEVEQYETERMKQVKNLQTENEDIVGWLEIEDTKINYPVLQGNDDEYYLTHNYKKEKTQKGLYF